MYKNMIQLRKYFHTWREYRAVRCVKKDYKDMIDEIIMPDLPLKKKVYEDWKRQMSQKPKTIKQIIEEDRLSYMDSI